MKKLNHSRESFVYGRHSERGQIAIIVVLALGLFLLAFTGLAVDYSNLWFHRQAAQGAADAACQAGAMDMYNLAGGAVSGTPATFNPGFTPTAGASLDCSANSTATPCKYAALNGYSGTGLVGATASNDVTFSFPATTSIPGVTAPPASLAAVPFMRVDVVDRVKVYLSGLITRSRTQDVRATAKCGLVLATSPIPIIILNPSLPGSLSTNGTNATIAIQGGPQRSIQVNSLSATAVGGSGGNGNFTGTIDLHLGGPAIPPTGSDLGTAGGPATPVGTFKPGSTGHWYISSPIIDPFATLAAPPKPGAPVVPASWPAWCTSSPCNVDHGFNKCPAAGLHTDRPAGGCWEYAPGYYPSGICIGGGGSCSTGPKVAIFDAGIYWIENGLKLKSGSIVRPSNLDNTANGMGGTLFYFSGTESVSVTSDSGATTAGIDVFDTSRVPCSAPGSSPLPAGVPPSLNGNELLAPCVGPYGDPPLGLNRGILFFQDRSTLMSSGATWQGGGDFLLAGTMYFHQCHTNGTDTTGTSCSGSAYSSGLKTNQAALSLGGNSGSGTYLLGEIIVDTLSLGGNPTINMDLNPNATFSILKVALLQ